MISDSSETIAKTDDTNDANDMNGTNSDVKEVGTTQTEAKEELSKGTQTDHDDFITVHIPKPRERYSEGQELYDFEALHLIMDADCACFVDGVGTFLVFNYDSYLYLHMVRLHGDVQGWGFQGVGFVPSGMLPLSTSCVALFNNQTGDGKCMLFSTENEWVTLNMEPVPLRHEIFSRQLKSVLPSLPQDFSASRRYGRSDFKIICSDDKEIHSHSSVLASQWVDIHNVLVVDAARTSYKVRFPYEWIEPVISSFYGKSLNLDFDSAVKVAIVTMECDLLIQHVYAMRRIKQEDMTVAKALGAWKLINDQPVFDRDQVITLYLASEIQKKMSHLKDSEDAQEILKSIDKDKLIQLYNEMSESVGAEEKRMEDINNEWVKPAEK